MSHSFQEASLSSPLSAVLEVIQGRMIRESKYRGIPALKCPLDFWVYQELIYKLKPDYIIELGTNYGGSTLALADFCEIVGHGLVLSVDITQARVDAKVRAHPRIELVQQSAVDAFPLVRKIVDGALSVMVIEDSSHSYKNTLEVLELYSSIVTRGSYLIVEDSICHHGLPHGPKPGPYEAISDFLRASPDFVADRKCESFLITWNPSGYLKRLPAAELTDVQLSAPVLRRRDMKSKFLSRLFSFFRELMPPILFRLIVTLSDR